MSKNLWIIVAAAAVGGQAAYADSLGTVDMKYIGNGLLKSGLDYRAIEGATTHVASVAGNLRHQMQNKTGEAAWIDGSPLSTFCIELGQYTSGSFARYDVVHLDEAPNPATSGPGDVQYNAQIVNRINAVLRSAIDLGFLDERLQTTGSSTANNQSAVQLAIWESIWESTDSNLNLASGNSKLMNNANNSMSGVMSSTNSLLAGANAYLQNLGNLQYISGLRALVNNNFQDQLVVVPLPTAALAGFGLLGGAVAVRRIRASR